MIEFLALAQQCAPKVAPTTMARIVNVESNYNPYAIGVVNGHLTRQPKNLNEAVATVKALVAKDWNFSVGLAQVNRYNLTKYNVSYEQAFDPCTSLRIGSKILEKCFVRAKKRTENAQTALESAFSCYYSGNFTRGFIPDSPNKPSYVQKVLASADVVPAIPIVSHNKPSKNKRTHSVRVVPAVKITSEPVYEHSSVLLKKTNPSEQKKIRGFSTLSSFG
ncbi:MAG: lytic transglycosylase domain-containing protein [gamma proteobacterium symbiont of Lucinoma myriamae]|nr:lytic transglycosylase domain-containing protein [gamma proteobacterium symbiont of Lucinoma myriamae]